MPIRRAVHAALAVLSLAVAAAGLSACGGDGSVHTLHGEVADGLTLSVYDTARQQPWVFFVVALCTDDGIPTVIRDVRLDSPIAGRIDVMSWATQDSDTIRPGDPDQPGAAAGTIKDYPRYTTAPIRNPCRETDRESDLLIQVERTSESTAGVPGLTIDYSTADGHGHIHLTEQIAMCAKPNEEQICHGLARR